MPLIPENIATLVQQLAQDTQRTLKVVPGIMPRCYTLWEDAGGGSSALYAPNLTEEDLFAMAQQSRKDAEARAIPTTEIHQEEPVEYTFPPPPVPPVEEEEEQQPPPPFVAEEEEEQLPQPPQTPNDEFA